MSDEKKEVEYRFTGDVSSLYNATKEAINSLSQYEDAIKKATAAGTFQANKTSFNALSKTINNIIRQVNSFGTSLGKVSAEAQTSLLPDTSKMRTLNDDLSSALTMIRDSTNITSKDVKFLTEYLKESQQAVTQLADKARILSSSFAEVKNLNLKIIDTDQIQNVSKIGDSFKAASETAEESTTKISQSADTIRRSFGNFDSIFDPFKDDLREVNAEITSMEARAEEAANSIGRMAEASGSRFRQFTGDAEDAAAAGEAVAASEGEVAAGAAALGPEVTVAIAALNGLKKVFKSISTACKNAVKSGINLFKKSLDSFDPKIKSFSGSFNSLLQLFGGLGSGGAIGEAIKSAVTYIENLNLFTVAMGDAVNEALDFVDAMSEIYGMDPSNLYRYAGYFNQLTDAIGMANEASKTISLSLTKAANDISSLFNVGVETVVNNLAAGMQGMSRAVRKYGIDIRQITLAQTALNYGFTENVSTTSEANRQALRYLTIMDQVKNATKQVVKSTEGATSTIGDFARNIETPANQFRILKEQTSQVARAFGNLLIPVLQRVLYVVNGVLMAIKTLLSFFGALIGLATDTFGGEISAGANDAAEAVAGIGGAAGGAAKELKKLIAPFDELTILTEPKDSGGGGGGAGSELLDPALAAAIEAMSLGLDEIRMKALDVRDKILDLLGLSLEGGEITVTIGGFIDNLINLWDKADYQGFGARVAEFLNQGIEWGIEHTDPSIYAAQIRQKAYILTGLFNGFVREFDWAGLGTIIGNGITLALNFIDAFLFKFDWLQLGNKLSELLNGVVDAVDFELLGKTLGDYFRAKIELLLGIVEKFEWGELGTKFSKGFKSFLKSIPWKDLGSLLAKSFNGVVQFIKKAAEEYEWGTLGRNIATFLNTAIDEADFSEAGETLNTVISGILEELKTFLRNFDWQGLGNNIGEFLGNVDWLKILEDVLIIFIAVLEKAIQLKVSIIGGLFAGLGGDIAEGFQDGIVEGFKNIGTWLKEHLVDPVIEAVKDLFGIHSPSTVFAEIGGDIVQGLLNGIENPLANIASWIRTKITDPIKNTVKDNLSLSTFRNIGSDIVNALMDGMSSLGSKLTQWGNEIGQKVSNTADKVKNTVNTAISSTKTSTPGSSSSFSVGTVISKPKLATGGVVRGPTDALIGEGKYPEAVIPLGSSPELQDMIDKIAQAVSSTPTRNSNSDTPIEVHVYLDGMEITSYQNRVNRMYGRTQQNI